MYKVYCDDYLIFDTHLDAYKIINPKLNLELNKAGAFEFTIYPNHPNFNKLQKMKSIVTVYQDGDLIFRGRILNDDEGFHSEKQVSCEGELAFFVDSIQRPYEFSGSPTTLFEQLINNHNSQVSTERQFKVGNVTVTDPNDYIARSDTQYLNTWDSLNQKLVTPLGGYLIVRHETDGNYIDWIADFNVLSNQTIEFGKNLLDFNKSVKGEDIATAIIPLGAKLSDDGEERLTIAAINDGVDYVYDQTAVDRYGWIFKTVVWDDVTVPQNLMRKANAYLGSAVNLVSSLELSSVDLAGIGQDVNAFKLGVYVKVLSIPHNLDTNFLVKKMQIYLCSPQSNKLTLGTTYSTFTEENNSAIKAQGEVIQNVAGELRKNISGAIADIEQRTSSTIEQSATEILSQVRDDYYLKSETDQLIESQSTQLTQTKNEFEFKFNQFSQDINDVMTGTDAKFADISKYIRFVDGNIILGEVGNELMLRIENDKITFLESGAEIAYWKNRKFYAVDGEFINSLRLGNFAFLPRSNGNLTFKKVT